MVLSRQKDPWFRRAASLIRPQFVGMKNIPLASTQRALCSIRPASPDIEWFNTYPNLMRVQDCQSNIDLHRCAHDSPIPCSKIDLVRRKEDSDCSSIGCEPPSASNRLVKPGTTAQGAPLQTSSHRAELLVAPSSTTDGCPSGAGPQCREICFGDLQM